MSTSGRSPAETPRFGSKSSPEILMAEQLRQAGIPFVMEYKFHPSRRWRCDFALEHNILVEVEGGAYVGGRHVTGSGFEKDAEKYNAAAELDFTVLRYTPRMVNDGTALDQIRRILSKKLEEPNRDAA